MNSWICFVSSFLCYGTCFIEINNFLSLWLNILIPIHDRFFLIYIYSIKLCIVHIRKINLLDKTFISRERTNSANIFLQTKKPDSRQRRGLGERFSSRRLFVSLATARLARESPSIISRARLSCINAWRHKWEGRRSAARMRRMEKSRGRNAWKRREETSEGGVNGRNARKSGDGRGEDLTSGRRMKRSWFVSA